MKTRHDVRDALTTLLSSALVGAGKPCHAVTAYPLAKIDGSGPTVSVQSAGSSRAPLTFEGSAATYHILVTVLVLHTDGDAWGEDDAEDALDAIDELIATVIDANQRTTTWAALTAGRSTIDLVPISGAPYRREQIPLDVVVIA